MPEALNRILREVPWGAGTLVGDSVSDAPPELPGAADLLGDGEDAHAETRAMAAKVMGGVLLRASALTDD